MPSIELVIDMGLGTPMLGIKYNLDPALLNIMK